MCTTENVKMLNEMNNLNENLEITILNDKTVKKKSQTKEVLPQWIEQCIKIDNSISDSKPLTKIPIISENITKILNNLKFTSLFPVQHTVIPAIIDSWSAINIFRPKDICVCAPTGSGKTLAYAVPILQILSQDQNISFGGPRAIVILPVRDLAAQVFSVFESIAKGINIKCALLAGHKNLAKEREDLFLHHAEPINGETVDIIICTPGRLVEHIKNTEHLDLSSIRHLVIDEADRVLADPKHDWFLTLTRHIGQTRRFKDIHSSFMQSGTSVMHKILLSATLTSQPHLLEHFDLHYPKLFVIGGQSPSIISPSTDMTSNYAAPDGLKEYFVVYDKEYARIIFIVDQIRRVRMSRILCFTNTKESAVRLNQLLNEFTNVRSAHLHCQQAPDVRQKLRQNLEKGNIDIIVTVDSMGRGIDIAGVKCVIQYEVQNDVCVYIHRVGRTARAGQSGLAYALVTSQKIFHLKKNLINCGRQIKNHKFSTGKCFKYLNEYNAALAKLQNSSVVSDDQDL